MFNQQKVALIILFLVIFFASSCSNKSLPESCGEDQKCFIDAMVNNCENKTVEVKVSGLHQRFTIIGIENGKCIIDGEIIDVFWKEGLEKTPENKKEFKETRKLFKGTKMVCKVNSTKYIDRGEIGSMDVGNCEGSFVEAFDKYTRELREKLEKMLMFNPNRLREENSDVDWETAKPYTQIKLASNDIDENWKLNDIGYGTNALGIQGYNGQLLYFQPEQRLSDDENIDVMDIYYEYYINEEVAKVQFINKFGKPKWYKLSNIGDMAIVVNEEKETIFAVQKDLLLLRIRYPDEEISKKIAKKILAKWEEHSINQSTRDTFKIVTLTAEDIGEGWELYSLKAREPWGVIQYIDAQGFSNEKKKVEGEGYGDLKVYYDYYNNAEVAESYEKWYYDRASAEEIPDLGDKAHTGIVYVDTIYLNVRKGPLSFRIEYPDLNFSTQIANKILAKLE